MDWGRDINVTGVLFFGRNKKQNCVICCDGQTTWTLRTFRRLGYDIMALAEAFLRKLFPTDDNLFFSGAVIPKFLGNFEIWI